MTERFFIAGLNFILALVCLSLWHMNGATIPALCAAFTGGVSAAMFASILKEILGL